MCKRAGYAHTHVPYVSIRVDLPHSAALACNGAWRLPNYASPTVFAIWSAPGHFAYCKLVVLNHSAFILHAAPMSLLSAVEAAVRPPAPLPRCIYPRESLLCTQ